MFGVGIAEAGTLGWAATITTVAQEVRNIGFVCLGLAIVLMGMTIIFQRRLQELGHDLSSVSIGAVLISTGLTAAAALVGAGGAVPLAPVVVHASLAESLGLLVWQGPVFLGGVWLWRRIRG